MLIVYCINPPLHFILQSATIVIYMQITFVSTEFIYKILIIYYRSDLLIVITYLKPTLIGT